MKIEARRIINQILIWGITWFVMSFLLNKGIGNSNHFFQRSFIQILGIAAIIFINLKYLLPHLYFKKRLVAFVLTGILLFVLIVLILTNDLFPWSDWIIHQESPSSPIREGGRISNGKSTIFGIRWMRHIVPFFMAFLGSTLIEVSRFANQKEREKLSTELKFLKSQINPHFLFNTLNNIYCLTVIKSDDASKKLLDLSSLLRYMLYDTNEEFVSLKKEIEHLKNYISLSLLKDSKGMNVSFDFDESQPNLRIAPLLFIPFVENAFKHSKIDDLENGTIVISLKTFESMVEYEVKNSIPDIAFEKDKIGGIGIANTTKRLELIYPQRHSLNISSDDNIYSVNLKIDLS